MAPPAFLAIAPFPSNTVVALAEPRLSQAIAVSRWEKRTAPSSSGQEADSILIRCGSGAEVMASLLEESFAAPEWCG